MKTVPLPTPVLRSGSDRSMPSLTVRRQPGRRPQRVIQQPPGRRITRVPRPPRVREPGVASRSSPASRSTLRCRS